MEHFDEQKCHYLMKNGFKTKKIKYIKSDKTCELSDYLFTKVKLFFKLNNFLVCENIDEAEIVLFDTCGYSQFQIDYIENKIDSVLRSISNNHDEDKLIIIFGCLPKITDKYNLDSRVICIGSKDLNQFNRLFQTKIRIQDINALQINNHDGIGTYQSYLKKESAYVYIGQGCLNNCTYCNIKKAKGNIGSVPLDKIQEDVNQLIKNEKFNFTLLADDCGSYGVDIGTNIVELLDTIFSLDSRIKVNIIYFYPSLLIKHFPDLKKYFIEGRISYINIPLQSSSDRILDLMNRNYKVNDVTRIIQEIKSLDHNIWIMTHIIFCFPSETYDEFKSIMSISEYFDEIAYSLYSDNKETIAYNLDHKIPKSECSKRVLQLENYLRENDINGIVVSKT